MIFLIVLTIILFSVIIHECAHGWVAERYGDPTARLSGRLTLNPLPHIDPIGTLLLPAILFWLNLKGIPVIIFGWAKPVPVNFRNLRNPKEDMMKVGAAGPLSNILLVLFAVMILKVAKVSPYSLLGQIIGFGAFINLILATFNLIPIPPLDGSRIVMGVLPPRMAYNYSRLEPYGIFIIIGALLVLPGLLGSLFKLIIDICKLLGIYLPFFK
ncbi:MAG TPA: site-2 protease family protein [bacterium]|nr:site-2 protease family protein [bacterium]